MKKLILLLIINTVLYAQQGPEVTCLDCDSRIKKTTPLNGMWYNPEQSGSGYSIEVQNRKLFGTYYGYNENGKSTWWTFQGDLVPSDNPEVMWTVDSDLSEFKNGNCINCNYQPPESITPEKSIHFAFKQKNYASVSFDDGPEQNIVPIIFGVPKEAEYPEHTSYIFPELAGTWLFMFDINEDTIPYYWQWGYFIREYSIDGKYVSYDEQGNKELSYLVTDFYGSIEGLTVGEIKCSIKTINDVQGPSCMFTDNYGASPNWDTGQHIDYNFSLGGMGAFRLFGESEGGHTFEAIRYDYTFFGEIPE